MVDLQVLLTPDFLYIHMYVGGGGGQIHRVESAKGLLNSQKKFFSEAEFELVLTHAYENKKYY